MKRFLVSLIILLPLQFVAFAQDDSQVLLSVGSHEITKAEFEHIYNKNNNNLYNQKDKKSPEEYLKLFIDFKLKVVEAEVLKMDTSGTFRDELAGYREEIAAPYLTDVKYEDELVHELYERMKREISASHILLRLDKNASFAKDTEVLAKITAIRQEVVEGKDFGQAAMEYSEDPSAKTNKGNLGYFTAFMMVTPFEDAAYTTPIGQLSQPVKTDFGYHLIKVHHVRENKGEMQVAHIMKNTPKNASAEQIEKAKTEIDAIYQQLLAGADFSELAKKESQDKRSAVKGGEMPWFSAGRIIPEFSKAAFALKNNGDFCAPIKTDFGYHIIKRLDARTVAPFEKARADIESRIKKDAARRTSSKKVFIDKLKKEYNFSENKDALQQIQGISVSSNQTLPQLTLFTIDNKDFQLKDFNAFIEEKNIKGASYNALYNEWLTYEVSKLEDSKLEEKYPEFRYLMNEYHDGILLFNISQDKIWNYASEDSIGLQEYFNATKNKHQWGIRFKGAIIKCQSPAIREKAEELFGSGLTNDEVLLHLNADKNRITINEGAWEEGRNEIVDYYVWNGKEPENFNSATTFVRGNKIDPETKQLDDARGLYISDYQNYLEEKWLKELRKKYKVKVNKKLLKTIEGA